MYSFIIKYWLEVLFGTAIAGLSMGYKRLKSKLHRRADEQKKIREGLIALLHDRIFQSGMYFIEQGEIPLSVLNNITEMYEAYTALGGNGTGTEIYERVRELPLKK